MYYKFIYHFSTLSSPELIFPMIALTVYPSTVAPKDYAVPRTYLTVPVNVLANDFSSTALATLMTYSRVKFPLCLTFLVFFLSLSYP